MHSTIVVKHNLWTESDLRSERLQAILARTYSTTAVTSLMKGWSLPLALIRLKLGSRGGHRTTEVSSFPWVTGSLRFLMVVTGSQPNFGGHKLCPQIVSPVSAVSTAPMGRALLYIRELLFHTCPVAVIGASVGDSTTRSASSRRGSMQLL